MISKIAVRILLPFSKMYLCEVEFSESQKGQLRTSDHGMTVVLSTVSPHISLLC